MRQVGRHDLIKRLQSSQPRGAPFDLADLSKLSVSAQLAAKYVRGGWLVRLAQGVYAFPGDNLDEHRTIQFLQAKVAGLHVAGKSALALQGVRHNLASRNLIILWGDERFHLPDWFLFRFPARYVSAQLFDWRDKSLAKTTLTTPPGVSAGLAVSVPERAALELLYEAGTHQGVEEAHNLFAGMRNVRADVAGRLLSCCTSIKTVRLFLTWARETGLVDADALNQRYPLPVGSAKRWMTRLKDGTLLTLRPHG